MCLNQANNIISNGHVLKPSIQHHRQRTCAHCLSISVVKQERIHHCTSSLPQHKCLPLPQNNSNIIEKRRKSFQLLLPHNQCSIIGKRTSLLLLLPQNIIVVMRAPARAISMRLFCCKTMQKMQNFKAIVITSNQTSIIIGNDSSSGKNNFSSQAMEQLSKVSNIITGNGKSSIKYPTSSQAMARARQNNHHQHSLGQKYSSSSSWQPLLSQSKNCTINYRRLQNQGGRRGGKDAKKYPRK